MNKITCCAAGAAALLLAGSAPALAAPGCHLGNGIKHIVYLQFDNVHLRRDNPNVPSDLEQIPNLLNFVTQNGTMLANHHTPLISHTSVDIITSLTGVYGENFGFSVGNSFGFFDPTGTPHFTSSFASTTASPIEVPEMVDQNGKIHPAPWVPFTRAGCDVGAFSLNGLELESTGVDVNTVFGNPSAEATEVATDAASPDPKVRAQPAADFEGIAIHCAKNSSLCGASPHARPDVLNDEPGGYTGFQALFGNKYVAPAINSGQGFVLDLDGLHVTDSLGNDGFPSSFDPAPSQSLGYVAQMLEAGVDVVYFYIEDAHDNHVSSTQFTNCPTNVDGTFGLARPRMCAKDRVDCRGGADVEAGARVQRRLAESKAIERDDLFPGQHVGGTPAHVDNIARHRQAATGARRPNARPA